MSVRTLGQLRRVQSELLRDYKQRRSASSQPAAIASEDSAAVRARASIGRVDEVVTSDAKLGAHLKVRLQRFSGSPPVADNAAFSPQVFYPAPGRDVGDYAMGEFVLLHHLGGVRFATTI